MRNRLNLLVLMVFIILFSVSISFAQEPTAVPKAQKASINDIVKIMEKCTKGVSYITETTTKINDKEVTSKTAYYYKNLNNYRTDYESGAEKARMVISPKAAWSYSETRNKIDVIPAGMVKEMDPVKAIKNQGKDAVVTKEVENNLVKYIISVKNSKAQTIYYVDEKTKTFVKMLVMNAQGAQASETIYKDYKFGKIDETLFAKPDLTKPQVAPAPAPAAPVAPAPATPATGEVKVEAPAAPATGEVKTN